MPENSPRGTLVGVVEAADPDGDVVGLALQGQFQDRFILAGDELRVLDPGPLDFEGEAEMSVRFRVEDDDGIVRMERLTVRLEDVNEAPFYRGPGTPYAFPEGLYAETLVGSVAALDVDEGDQLTYALAEPLVPFRIDPDTGDLYLDGLLDFESGPTFRPIVVATDRAGLTARREVVVEARDEDVLEAVYPLSFASTGHPWYRDSDPCAIEPVDIEVADNFERLDPVIINAEDDNTRYVAVEIEGDFDLSLEIAPDQGEFEAWSEGRLAIEFPDEVPAGRIVAIPAVWHPESTRISGQTPGIRVSGSFLVLDGVVRAFLCDVLLNGDQEVNYGAQCERIARAPMDQRDPSGRPAPFEFGDQIRGRPYAAENDPETPGRVAVPARESSTGVYEYTQQGWVDWISTLTGTPNINTVAVEYDLGSVVMNLLISVFRYGADVSGTLRAATRFEAPSVQLTIVLENGNTHAYSIPTCAETAAPEACLAGAYPTFDLPVPHGADVNGDGAVEIEMEFALEPEIALTLERDITVRPVVTAGHARADYFFPERPNDRRERRDLGPAFSAGQDVDFITDCSPDDPAPPFNTIRRSGALDLR